MKFKKRGPELLKQLSLKDIQIGTKILINDLTLLKPISEQISPQFILVW
jgi:hypothetical protein